jgi:hypothetical protein
VVEEIVPVVEEVIPVVEAVKPSSGPGGRALRRTAPPARKQAVPAGNRTTWQTVKTVAAWPVRLFGLLCAFYALVGWGRMWPLPKVAAGADVAVFDLLLRCVEFQTDHPIDPFYVLRPDDAIQKGIAQFATFPNTVAATRTVQKGPHEFEHEVTGTTKSAQWTVRTTTPHLVVAPGELDRARRGVEAMYPPDDRAARQALEEWGKGLFLLYWLRRNDPTDVSWDKVIEPRDGTQEERLWLVWQALSAGQPDAERDLQRLPALLAEAYPRAEDRTAAGAWARTLYGRLRDNARDHQQAHGEGQSDDIYARAQGHAVWLPPDNDVTMAWLLYQYVGLTEASRRAARARWLGFFPPAKAERALAWGRQLADERRAAGEPLPPGGDEVALLCVLERYLGTDVYGARGRQAYQEHWPPSSRSIVAGFVQVNYPSDDFFYVAASADRLQLFTDNRALLLVMLVYVLLLGYSLRFVILTVLGEWVLRLGNNPIYRRYREGGGHRGGWPSRVLAYGVIPVASWLLALATNARELDLLVESPGRLFLGVYLAVLLGGTLIGVVARLIAVLLIRLGIDVEKTWLDEILGIAAGAFILRHFGNDWLSIAAYASFELAPTVLGRLLHRPHVPAVAVAVPAN